MKTVIFIRTAPYQYKQKGKTLYDSLDLIGQQEAQPPISAPLSVEMQLKVAGIKERYKFHKTRTIICSESVRSQQTAQLFAAGATATPLLNEIRFSMTDFSQKKDLLGDSVDPQQVDLIRKNFSLALLRDSLQESQENILDRIREFAGMMNTIPDKSVILCCSHSFIMKLFENFLRRRCIVEGFSDLVQDHDWGKAPYGFLDGFILHFNDIRSQISDICSLNQCV